MAQLDLSPLQSVEGFQAVALVDSESGLTLATLGTTIDLELAAAGNTEVLNAKRRACSALGIDDTIEDIFVTLGQTYHFLRPLEKNQSLFLYLVLDRSRANLAMARHELRRFEQDLDFS